MIYNCGSPMLRNLQRRSVHSIARPAASVIQGETPVVVYQSKEHADLVKINGHHWDTDIVRSNHRAKVFSLIPFFAESTLSHPKNFVLKLELYPKA